MALARRFHRYVESTARSWVAEMGVEPTPERILRAATHLATAVGFGAGLLVAVAETLILSVTGRLA